MDTLGKLRKLEIEKLRKRYVMSALRRISLWWPERTKAKQAARVSRGISRCAICGKKFRSKDMQVDHIIPVINVSGFNGYDGPIKRLLCYAEEFQVLCRNCHKEKTNQEKQKRRKKD